MAALPSGLPDIVGKDEDIVRFLCQSGHYNSTGARPAAFYPKPESKETSVSRHGIEPRDILWQIGLLAAGTRKLHGAIFLKAADILDAGLAIDPSEPPLRHGAMRNWFWSADNPDLQRSRQLVAAQLLASKSVNLLHYLRPNAAT